jgi:hypothetical protein
MPPFKEGIVMSKSLVNFMVLALIAVASAVAGAQIPTFQIAQVYSSLDGTQQFVELREVAGLNGQNHFAGLTLTSTHDGVVKQFTFPSDLPTDRTANISVVVAAVPYPPGPDLPPTIFQFATNFVVAYHPDFVVPSRFVATDGGTVSFAGTDQVTYASLPTDGATSLFRDGTTGPAVLPAGTIPGGLPGGFAAPQHTYPTPPPVAAVEYYSVGSDRYFITASAPEIDAIDSGQTPGWQRTGESFTVGGSAKTDLGLEYHYVGGPVCRFYIPLAVGDSHFYSGSQQECAAVAQLFPSFVLESHAAFYAALPDTTTGECPAMRGVVDGDIPMVPIYRLWDGRQDANHRLTTSLAVRSEMIARGWLPEGYGPVGVVMCAG